MRRLFFLNLAIGLWSITTLAWAACAVSSQCAAGPNQDPSCRFTSTILPGHDNGTTNRIQLVFLGDGYTQAELPQYHQDVDRVVAMLFHDPNDPQNPFQEYASYLTVHRVDVISHDSGTDRPAVNLCRDTALDTEYDSLGCSGNVGTQSGAKVYRAAKNISAPVGGNVFVVLANDATRASGCSAQTSFVSVVAARSPESPADVAHELGHSFGGLADEYTLPGGGHYTGSEPDKANITTVTDPRFIKWRAWFRDSTKPETTCPSSTPEAVGLFEGALGFERGIFRPTCNSKMRDPTQPWGAVNAEELVKQIYRSVKPIDAMSPQTFCPGVNNYCADVSGQQRQSFSLTPLQPASSSLNVTWTLDGATVQTSGTDFLLDANQVSLGDHQLKAIVEDQTVLVRTRGPKTLKQEATWTVRLNNHAPTLSAMGNHTTLEGLPVTFLVAANDMDSDPLTVTITSGVPDGKLPDGAQFTSLNERGLPARYRFSWMPTRAQRGLYPLLISVDDGKGGVTSETMSIRVCLTGDLNDDGEVTIDELLKAVNFGLGSGTPSPQELGRIDRNGDGQVTIEELLTAVNNALNGPGKASVIAALDRNHSGAVEGEEMALLLQGEVSAPVLGSLTARYIAPPQALLSVPVTATDPGHAPLTLTATPLPAGARFLPLGDVDMDGHVTELDATRILEYAVGFRLPSEVQRRLADMTGEGQVSAIDASRVLSVSQGVSSPPNTYLLLWRPTLHQQNRSYHITIRAQNPAGLFNERTIVLLSLNRHSPHFPHSTPPASTK